ncbi:CmcI family methyltransferase [Embleya sp. NPDC008237]|uniref:CmcI family methyltransferase n=1 Tax=Embleya sp. NPDC008237 TaxID=3363978 RepID=UPI0036E7DD0A
MRGPPVARPVETPGQERITITDHIEVAQLPPTVTADHEATLLEYRRARGRQHVRDWYAGLRIKKFPEDLRVFEHVMWSSRAQVVVELGTHLGGSALWFRDRLRTQAGYGRVPEAIRVISVDLDQDRAAGLLRAADPAFEREITLVAGDVTDPRLVDRVADLIPPGARCLVVEDTLHEYATTTAALRNFAHLVPEGGFFVVEDGIVDDPDLCPPGMPGGVLPAIADWLATEQGGAFTTRRDLELYGVTSHPHGWLQRIEAGG